MLVSKLIPDTIGHSLPGPYNATLHFYPRVTLHTGSLHCHSILFMYCQSTVSIYSVEWQCRLTIFAVAARCYYTLPLHTATLHCDSTLRCHSHSILSLYTVTYNVTTLPFYTAILHCHSTLSCYTADLHCCHGTLLLYTVTLHWHSTLRFHCHTVGDATCWRVFLRQVLQGAVPLAKSFNGQHCYSPVPRVFINLHCHSTLLLLLYTTSLHCICPLQHIVSLNCASTLPLYTAPLHCFSTATLHCHPTLYMCHTRMSLYNARRSRCLLGFQTASEWQWGLSALQPNPNRRLHPALVVVAAARHCRQLYPTRTCVLRDGCIAFPCYMLRCSAAGHPLNAGNPLPEAMDA